MTKIPTVTVLMPVYNGERFIRDAIDSILQQSYSDFELLIVNDSSTDRTVEIIESYTDTRIRLVHNETNLKHGAALNRGLDLARGQYIARMDSDDISCSTRLEKQKFFLDHNQNIALIGSWAEIIDEKGKSQGIKTFLTDSPLLKWKLLFCNTFIHSSMMFRKSCVLLLQSYDCRYTLTEDYDLWSRISFEHEVANIPEILVKWRKWGGSVSSIKAEEQQKETLKISRRNMQRVWGQAVNVSILEHFMLLYNAAQTRFDLNCLDELIVYRGTLIKTFINKFNYTDPFIVKNIHVEIDTHLFSLILRTPNVQTLKIRLLLHWLIKTRPKMVRALFIYLFKRTVAGARIRKLFYKGRYK
jgi:glycosyltransferase involved in cell wall biosynthesis